mmetsp:Transcript_128072/g.332092  ORF Transcript_128072/g.332092 Transcript_128072/m.332092 type:complete len:199 (+) Transcript_128072:159-755(+)
MVRARHPVAHRMVACLVAAHRTAAFQREEHQMAAGQAVACHLEARMAGLLERVAAHRILCPCLCPSVQRQRVGVEACQRAACHGGRKVGGRQKDPNPGVGHVDQTADGPSEGAQKVERADRTAGGQMVVDQMEDDRMVDESPAALDPQEEVQDQELAEISAKDVLRQANLWCNQSESQRAWDPQYHLDPQARLSQPFD